MRKRHSGNIGNFSNLFVGFTGPRSRHALLDKARIMTKHQPGLLYAFAAIAVWGGFPFFLAADSLAPLAVIGHRMI